MARPRKNSPKREKEISEQLEKLAAINCNWKECAAVLGEKDDYLQKRFSSNYVKGRENGKMTLKRKMWQTAMGGNVVMMIWLSKQMVGYTDKVEQKNTNTHNIDVSGLKDKTTQELLDAINRKCLEK